MKADMPRKPSGSSATGPCEPDPSPSGHRGPRWLPRSRSAGRLDSAIGDRVALKPLPIKALRPLLRQHLSGEEDADTADVVASLRQARRRKYLTKSELERICRWKSARAMPLIRANSHQRIRAATWAALTTKSERRRLEALVSLHGVSVPMASAILMLLHPRRYGVIDIRVWQLLVVLGTVKGNERGTGFTFAHWYRFLMIIRYFARSFGVSARDIERTLFLVHREYQAGRLYRTPGKGQQRR